MLPFPIISNTNIMVKKEIKKIDASQNHLALLYSTGKLYTRGSNSQGNIGNGSTSQAPEWTLVQDNVFDVSVSNFNTLIRKNDGTIWCSGLGYMMNLGNTPNYSFVDITSLFGSYVNKIKEIQIGLYSILFLTNENDLYGLGYNYYGELGANPIQSYRGPTLIANNVRKMRLSLTFSGYISSTGIFYRAGLNSTNYNLGNGTTTNLTTFVPYSSVQAVDFKFDGFTTFILATSGSGYEIHNAGSGILGSLCTGSTSNKTTFSKLTQFTKNTSLNDKSFDFIGCTGGGSLFKGTSDGDLITGGYNPSNQFSIFGGQSVKNELSSTSYGVPQVNLINCKLISIGSVGTMIITPDNNVYACSSPASTNSVAINLGISGTNTFKLFNNYLPNA